VRRLDASDVERLEAFRATLDFKLHLIALVEVLVSITDDGLVVDEHILAIRSGDETEALCSVEPLHCSLFHRVKPFVLYKSATGGHGGVHPGVCLYVKNRSHGLFKHHSCDSAFATGLYKTKL